MTTLRVLIVDDNPEVLKVMKRTIERTYPGSTIAIRSPHLALEAITRFGQHFDVVIADLFMPRMSGDEFLGHVRELMPGATRILVTGFSDLMATDLEEGLAHHVFKKPFDSAELIAVLARAKTPVDPSPSGG